MSSFLFPVVLPGLLLPVAALARRHPVNPVVADVCVYGGQASGVMATVVAKRAGKSVTIVEPARALGGILASFVVSALRRCFGHYALNSADVTESNTSVARV